MASMASVPAQSLECVICQELYDEPKQLSCTHTFCQKCLTDLLNVKLKENKLTCPVCRQTTQVEDGDVSKLETNFPIKSLVEDLKSANKVCTVCNDDNRSPAVAYCQTCGDYMCITCLEAHGKWKKNSEHVVVHSEDISSGKVKVKKLCKKHPQEEMEWVCSTCKVPICLRCRMLYHNGPNHEVEEVAEIQKALKEEAKLLQKEAEDTVKVIKDHIKVTQEENVKSRTILDEKVADVVRAFEDFLGDLTKEKDKLVEKLEKLKEEMTGNLQHMEECDLKLLSGINSARQLITKGAAGFLEGESLVVHQRLCTELRELMKRADCDDKIPRGITEQAESIKFTRSQRQQDLKLGELTVPGMDSKTASANLSGPLEPTHGDKLWNLKKVGALSMVGNGVNDMAPTPDGRMAVCFNKGGVELFTVKRQQDRVLLTDSIQSISFLSDGRCSVIDTDGGFSLYSAKFEKVSSPEVSSRCCYDVFRGKVNEILICGFAFDENHHVYDVLSMYSPDKREFVRTFHKISSRYYAVSHMNRRPYYVYETNNSYVKVANENFQEINEVKVEGSKQIPIVLEDDSILIGWVTYEGYATVDLYTYDLRHVRTVLQDFKIHGYDFHMAAFSTGEIAICDSRRIHIIFCKDYEV